MSMNLLNNSPRITTGFLNTVDDALPGQLVAGTAGLGPTYSGQLGGILVASGLEAARLAGNSITLYGGIYQYVRFKAGSTAANIRGGPVYWDDRENYVVTPDVPTGAPDFAGVSLNAVTKGNYGWILVGGKTHCHALANTTKAAPAIGDTLVLATAGNFDDILDATPYDGTNRKLAVGQWLEAPVDVGGGGLYLAVVEWKNPNF